MTDPNETQPLPAPGEETKAWEPYQKEGETKAATPGTAASGAGGLPTETLRALNVGKTRVVLR